MTAFDNLNLKVALKFVLYYGRPKLITQIVNEALFVLFQFDLFRLRHQCNTLIDIHYIKMAINRWRLYL